MSRETAQAATPAHPERGPPPELDPARFRLLGSGYQASVYLYDAPEGPLVVKKAHGSLLLGKVGRAAVRREQRVYERLRGVAGVPRSYGLVDGQYLVLEHVAGRSLRDADDSLADRPGFYEKLRETLDSIHCAGVAHGDLKRKANILVGPGEQPYVIDFGIARLREEGASWFSRWLFGWFKQSDWNAWIKLKYRRRFDALTPADRALYRPLLLERIARAIRIPAETITLRHLRKRKREGRRSGT